MKRFLMIVAACAAVAGCTYLPGAGPTTGDIRGDAVETYKSDKPDPYVIVGMNARISKALAAGAPPMTTGGFLIDEPPANFAINEGDTVQVSLVSINQDGFIDFSSSSLTPIALTPLPQQVVGNDGRVNVPPLGRVRARGLSPEQFERQLASQLSEVLIEPSVIVQILDRQAARASVLGQVEDPGSKAILRRDLRLLDLIGLAGGHSGPAEDLIFSFTRGSSKVRLPFTEILSDPANNIRIHPGDVVSIDLSRRSYVVRGAINSPGRYEFIEPTVTLSEAIGQARGIPNRRASRSGMFVFRNVERSRLQELGFNPTSVEGTSIPTIFHFDYRVPSTVFAEQSFVLEDGDVVFISDHIIDEINKVFGIFASVVPVQTFVPTPN